MRTSFKKMLSLLLAVSLLVGAIVIDTPSASAATVKLNKSSVTLKLGRSTKLKVLGTTSKITWRTTKKSVATVTSSGKVVGKKVGSAKICAKFDGKKLFCTVTVSGTTADTKAGGRLNPLSAYDEHTVNYYEDGKKVGTFKIKLEAFSSGKTAKNKVLKVKNPTPTNTQEYIYFRFNFTYVSGKGVVEAKDIFNYYYNLFDSSGTTQIENIDWGFFFELMEDLSDIKLSKGQTVRCSKAILINKGNTPVLYRIRTGKSSYTWFTTKK